jgi:polar amino acid transport system substrate-binding protein
MRLSAFLSVALNAAVAVTVAATVAIGPASAVHAAEELRSGIAAARQRGTLAVGLAYSLPAYVAGAKFRTPESPESTVAEVLAARLGLPLGTPRVAAANVAQALAAGRIDLALMLVDDGAAAPANVVLVPAGYRAGAMAIMRSDTDIRRWEQLKGRTVCLSEGGAYVGKMAAQYGAIEKVQRAPADSLLSLRIGACDAAVHDDSMLNGLLKLPEWKKFSARLSLPSRQTLMFALRADDAGTLAAVKQWSADAAASGFWADLQKKWGNNVAFEVYLDQNVPDCH